ncbi:MAG: M55 family metallopeptidase [Deltaproteobacteria bacterium]|nr:M55 family metallopeptidase [Deltaproteobacteria bacterium]
MKVFVSIDMEGITGVTDRGDVVGGQEGYERFRTLMVCDLNAAIEGAFAGGATEVLVNDSHFHMRNVLIEQLDSRAQLISGFTKRGLMMHGLSRSFDAVYFLGYHSRIGTESGVLNHTILGKEVDGIWINDQEMGGTGLNAALAGYYNVPVAMISGDDRVCKEAKDLLGDVETAVTKYAADGYAARCLPQGATHPLIKEAAGRALSRLADFKPYRIEGPVTFKVCFHSTSAAAISTMIPTVEKVDARTVVVRGDDYLRAYTTTMAVLLLA